jgi:hypothetical protein
VPTARVVPALDGTRASVCLNVTAIWTDRRYLDMSLLKPKDVAVAKAA